MARNFYARGTTILEINSAGESAALFKINKAVLFVTHCNINATILFMCMK